MFAIIMPAALSPAIVTLIYLDRKAHREGTINISSSGVARRRAELEAEGGEEEVVSWSLRAKQVLIEIDAFGLILLGFGWSLLLLPFSLSSSARGGWNNPSLIAMMIVGGLLLITYAFFEVYYAPVPSAPRRILKNRTFIMAVIVDFVYLRKLSDQLFSSLEPYFYTF